MTPEQIARGLTKAQQRALLAFSAAAEDYPGHYAKANELGVSGNTLRSLYGVARLAPSTMELGPILVTDEFTREGTFWIIEPLGLAVRAELERIADE